MSDCRRPLELLSPAKNTDFGIEAINHGADAVYIGGPAFGARAGAGNSLSDIERLTAHAHRYHARVFVALNTILRDNELDEARDLAWRIYEAGADALILQDMGLLEMELPPIQLHASTQTDIHSVAKARFLQDVGFSQLVLARELSLPEVRGIAAASGCRLEYFVHGALCVAYSGQCYISHAHTGRSANRGECSQACRLSYDLADSDGKIIAANRHLLSMKDNNQSANLRALIDAGISSFKIEGRYKDLSYVKNITSYYRSLLDGIIDASPELVRASSGHCTFLFTPKPEKTFNRGYTDYFTNERQHGIEAFESPKFVGEEIGTVVRIDERRRWMEIARQAPLHNGDGLSVYAADGELTGWRVNTAENVGEGIDRVSVSDPLPGTLSIGAVIYRNHDQAYERVLTQRSSQRRIGVTLRLAETETGYQLVAIDEDGITVSAGAEFPHEAARDAECAMASIRGQLSRLGNTGFDAMEIVFDGDAVPFLPASLLNALRRSVCEKLEAARLAAYVRPARAQMVEPPVRYPQESLSYLGNVLNAKARAFYEKHGVAVVEEAFEANHRKDEVSLMITRHCLRYSFNLCPKEVKGVRPEPMTLIHGRERLTLRFDCKKCEMHVIGNLKRSVARMQATQHGQPLRFVAAKAVF